MAAVNASTHYGHLISTTCAFQTRFDGVEIKPHRHLVRSSIIDVYTIDGIDDLASQFFVKIL